ncbi:fibronectin type III domain-containing protein [Halomontanus rarus]|uniref:rhamnogalacturonan lyase family protein n=1 Tax=Halomontanus rarus TaxID=3034020 RepID=UPI002FFB11C3
MNSHRPRDGDEPIPSREPNDRANDGSDDDEYQFSNRVDTTRDRDRSRSRLRRRTFLGGLASSAALLAVPGSAQQASGPAREMENLDRGVVAVQTDDGVLVRWRLLGTEPDGIGFNLYRDGQRVNGSPITSSTNYVDPDGSTGSTYTVAPIVGGTEGEASEPADVWENNYLDIPLNRPGEEYTPNDCSVGDLTGDGSYDVVVKWTGESNDNAHDGYTDPVILDAYTLAGDHLWRIDLGINVRAGAHYTQFLVYDFDGDGVAELVVRTADGTTDATGTVIGDPDADWRNDTGRILEGPEYLTVFDGSTGEELVTTDFEPARGDICSWGDCYGNRGERFLAGVAYLDGERPSIVQCRGYYERTALAAFDFRDGELTQRWHFDSADGWGEYAGQGNHQLSIADVDGDGYDEIVYGACVIDHDGTGLHSTGWNHGDALHCGDLIPSRGGLEIFMPHESGPHGATMRDAETGEPLWTVEASGDVGRGVAGNIDPTRPGAEAWASNGVGLREGGSGDRIADAPGPKNSLVWWKGDLKRELLDDTWIGEWDPGAQSVSTVADFSGVGSNNGTKANACLSGDILGDWREEVLLRRDDNEALRLFVTPYETNHRLYTLMHDSQYRTAIAWQNVAYNQPPHPSFYVGEDMDEPPTPNIDLVGAGEDGDTTPPSAPSDLRVDETTPTSISLSWNEPSDDDVVYYTVTVDGQAETIVDVGVSTVEITGLDTGTEYALGVRAVDDASNRSEAATTTAMTADGQETDDRTDGAGPITVEGGGADIWGQADAFHYYYTEADGDFDVAVRVDSVENTDEYAKAGLMVRESTDPDARNVMIRRTPDETSVQWRRTPGSDSQSTTTEAGAGESEIDGGTTADSWHRLVRSGETILAYSSSDGVEWTLFAALSVSLSSRVHVGLAVTSHDEGTLCTAEFSSLTGIDPANSQDIGAVSVSGTVDDGRASGPEPIGDNTTPPRDLDGDGLYEDIDGSGDLGSTDVVDFFDHLDEPVVTDHVDAYDFDGNGRISPGDVVDLFDRL